MMKKIILITGASKGFGKVWAEALLKSGHSVAGTSRNKESLFDLEQTYGDAFLSLQLDVTDRAACFAAVKKTKDHFGTIDVLINNAGYTVFGAIEEISEEESKMQFETNFFGLLSVTQAVLPIMREQGHGHIIQVSSVLGLVTLPFLGLYNASKFAVEGLTETLASEVAEFGIKVTLLEPNGYETDIWSGAPAKHQINDYNNLKEESKRNSNPDSFGDISATVPVIQDLVIAENPPLRLILGKVGVPFVNQVYGEKLANWAAWKEVSDAAHGK